MPRPARSEGSPAPASVVMPSTKVWSPGSMLGGSQRSWFGVVAPAPEKSLLQRAAPATGAQGSCTTEGRMR